MNPFSESDLAQLRQRFPERDVDRIALAVAKRHETQHFHSPVAMLTRWCQTAEEKDTDRLADRRSEPLYPRSDWAPQHYGERSDSTYAAFRFAVLQQVQAGLTPAATAELLAQHASKFADLPHNGEPGGLGRLLDAEIATYRAKGDRKITAHGLSCRC